MYSILVVDDEPIIRQGLRVLVDWRRHGFAIAAEAEDGEQALEILTARRFDLLLIDIRLPGLSGLELIKALRSQPSPPHIVILSAHAEFEYARAAVALGVRRYMLKPVDEEELSRTLEEIRRELDVERHGAARREIALLLRSLAHAEEGAECRELIRRLGKAGFKPSASFCCLILRAESSDSQARAAAESQEWLRRHHAGYIIEDGPSGILLFLHGARSPEGALHDRAEDFRACICKKLRTDLDMAVGDPVEDLLDLGRSYRSVRNRLLVAPRVAGKDPTPAGSPESALSVEAIDHAVRDADTGAVDREITAFATRVAHSSLGVSSVHATVIALLLLLGDMIPDRDFVARVDAQARAEDVAAMIATLREGCHDACRVVASASDGMIATLRDYLEAHCAERITIKAVADSFGYNASYLGRAFARRTGTSIREFLASCRVQRACRLLLDGNLKAYAVAEQVGFTDLNSFYSAFHKLKGCTPREYRLKIQRGLEKG